MGGPTAPAIPRCETNPLTGPIIKLAATTAAIANRFFGLENTALIVLVTLLKILLMLLNILLNHPCPVGSIYLSGLFKT